MAQDKTDKVTTDLFSELEIMVALQAMHAHIKTLKRQAASEQNEDIKKIREAEVKKFINLTNKMQGLV